MATIKNTNDLLSQAASDLPNNTTQFISPTKVRDAVENVAISSYNKLTDAPLVGLKAYNTLVTYESGQGAVNGGKIYISNQITGPGAFNAAHWDLYDNLSPAQKAKLDFISITQAVDLDAIEDAINNVTNPYLNKGLWDASTGVFPGGGSAKNGWTYICSVSGTVDGRDFVANQDKITALVNNASTSTYTSNWFKTDGSDLVTSIRGGVGAITNVPKTVTFATAPTITDDSAASYLNGDEWTDSVTGDRYKLKDNSIGAAVWEPIGGAESGKVGIYDANGKPTFYADLPSAFAAAVSGDTIHLFANITVAATPTIPIGVNLNGNNYTITNSTADLSRALAIPAGYDGLISNVTIYKTSFNAIALILFTGGLATKVKFSNVRAISDLGLGVSQSSTFSTTTIEGLFARGVSGMESYGGDVINCVTESTSGTSLYSAGGRVIDCVAKSTSGTAIQAVEAYSCYAVSVSGRAYNATVGYNCFGFTVSGIGADGGRMMDSYIYSSSGIGAQSYDLRRCSIRSETNCALSSFGAATAVHCELLALNNITIIKTTSAPHTIEQCRVLCLWNNVGGHAMHGGVGSIITNNIIYVVNASANLINGGTAYYKNNIDGNEVATILYTTTQLSSKLLDAQGNTL